MNNVNVTKRNGSLEPYDIQKIQRVVSWATEGLSDVNASDIEIGANLNITDGITTDQIHSVLIDSSINLISEETPDYQYVAGRLLNYQIRKAVWGGKNPPKLIDLIKGNIDKGYYTPSILEWYSTDEINKIDEFINHDQDLEYTYCSVKQFSDKYLVKNRHSNELHETPQFRYIVAALTLFSKYPVKTRLSYVKKAYSLFSKFKINLATPQLSGLGTLNNSFASCFPPEQKVMTKNGWKSIESILPGELVLTHLGTYEKVLAVANKEYSGSLVSLGVCATINGSFCSTNEHEVFAIKSQPCIRTSGYGSCNIKQNTIKQCEPVSRQYACECRFKGEEFNNPSWIRVKDLTVGDFVHIPFNNCIEDIEQIDVLDYLSQDVMNRLEFLGDKIKIKHHLTKWMNRYIPLNNDVLRTFGLFYAEGDANVDNAYVQFTLNQKDVDLKEHLMECFYKHFGIATNCHYNKNDNSCKVCVNSEVMSDFFVNYITSGFDTKKIHDTLMLLPPYKQKYLLKGCIEGDGCTYQQGVTMQLVNPFLIDQFKTIALRCKLYPNILEKDRSKEGYKNSLILVLNKTSNYEFIEFVGRNMHKVEKSKVPIYPYGFWVGEMYFAKILSKTEELINSIQVYDIQVDKNQSFSAGGISAHNCMLIEQLDTADSIVATNVAVAKATCLGYGTGINFGRMRGIGSSVRNGVVIHPGVVPFLKISEANAKAWQKNGIRGGSATVNFPIWHSEIETIVQLKNATTGTNDSRVFNLDYAIGVSKLFYERFIKNQDITLFSPSDVPGLYDVFGMDGFDELYTKYESDNTVRSKTINARELFSLIARERLETGRIYILNIDNMNKYGSWVKQVSMSNLCVAPETLLGTSNGDIPIKDLENQGVEVWNGVEWSKTKVVKTGTNQKLLRVELLDGKVLYSTPYHKWKIFPTYQSIEQEVRTCELQVGDLVIVFDSLEVHAARFASVASIQDDGRYDDTYCVNEPLRHKAVFNGILTGNCVEVTHQIEPLKSINDPDSEIGVCILAALNWLEITSEKDLEKPCEYAVRGLDESIDIQDYFDTAAKNFATRKRSLGIGITNLAAFLAKHKLAYTDPKAVELVNRWMEHQQYYLIKASVQLAKEKGPCEAFASSKYAHGWLPTDKDIAGAIAPELDWEALRADIKEHGMRHTTLTCQMPVESSSAVQNATNGVEPVTSLITYKSSKKSSIPFLVPNSKSHGKYYQLAYDMPDNMGYLNICNTIQRWMDMSMSVNQYFDPKNFPDGKISYSRMIKEMMEHWKAGGKSLYYAKSADHNTQFKKEDESNSCESGACAL